MAADNSPLIAEFFQFPGTLALILICGLGWAKIKSKGLGYPDVGLSYQNFVVEGQYWRMWTASFSHISVMHLALNLSSLWAYRFIEHQIGLLQYLKLTFLFVVLSISMVIALYHIIIYKFGRTQSLRVVSVGFSCVIFAWMSWATVNDPNSSVNLGYFKLPTSLAPFGSLIFTSIIVPQASFVGHLAGLIVGFMVGGGLFEWLGDYWLCQIAIWVLISLVVSLKTSRILALPWLEIGTGEIDSMV